MNSLIAAAIDGTESETLGERLQYARLERGWTRQELAERAGYRSTETIRRYEQELVRNPREAVLVVFAKILDVNPAWLITGRGPRERNTR